MKRSVAVAKIALVAFCAAPVFAAWDDDHAGHPALRSFGSADYGESAGNEAMVRDRRGRLYVANDHLLQYDGRTWSKIAINDAARVQSVALGEDDRIWVNAVGELGYLYEDETGTRSYHSLNAYLPPGVVPTDPWYVFRLRNRTLFVQQSTVLIWDGVRFELRSLPNPHRLFAFPFRDGIAVWQIDGGLWFWNVADFQLLTDQPPKGAACVWGIRGADGSELFEIGYRLRRLVDGKFVRLEPTGLEERLTLVVGAIQLPDGNICVASHDKGLTIIRQDGTFVRAIDRQDGMPSIECNGLFLDHENGLWVSTRRNIFRMDARNSETLFDSFNGLSHGATTLVLPHEDSMVALGDESALRLERPIEGRSQFTLIPSVVSFMHDAVVAKDGRLLLAAFSLILSPTPHSILRYDAPNEIYRLLAVGGDSPVVIMSAYRSLHALDTTEGITRIEPVLAELPDIATDLALDRGGKLWAATAAEDLFAIRYPAEGAGQRPINWKRGVELPADFTQPKLFLLAREAYAYTSRAVFRLTDRGDKVPVEVVPGLGLLAVERAGESDVWAIGAPDQGQPRLIRIEQSAGGSLKATAMECRSLHTIGQPLTVARDNAGRAVWIGGTNGLLRVELADLAVEKKPTAPELLRVVWRSPDGIRALPLRGGFKLAFTKDAAVDIDVRDARGVLDGPGRVEARLIGSDDKWTKAGLLVTYAGLQEGNYRFEARALDLEGKPGPIASYGFVIDPPWQRSTWAYVGYALCVVAVALVAIRIRTRRVARLNVQLEGLVNSRTEELTRAVSARSAFLANMGHEIRNPLNGVVGLVDSLQSDSLNPEQKQIVVRLGSCAAQLVSVVEDVMEYARVDAGRVSLRQRAFSLHEPMEAAMDVLRAADPTIDIAIDATLADLDARVVGDADRIRQVLVNYLANAAKFGGSSAITVGLRREADVYRFTVRDHGPGISADEQARLFVRFSRGSLAHQKAIPGTGLGLAACKAYAEAMGGEVGVESAPGRGSTFFLRLPLPLATEADNVPTVVTPDIMVGRIALVVDDHEFNRVVLTDLLGRMGASATSAEDIPSARIAFAAHVPDVVFVDFDLAGLTGADLANWIRTAAPAGRDVPIVATSAFEIDEVRQKCEEAGMDGFIVKPVTPQKIVTVMARIENIRSGGLATELQFAPSLETRVDMLDLMSDRHPQRRQDRENEARKNVLAEAVTTIREVRRGKLEDAMHSAHRLTATALFLNLREVVATSREVERVTRARDADKARIAARQLQHAVSAARRQFKG